MAAELDISGLNLPYNIEAEQAVLGTVLMDSKVMDDVAAELHAECFYHELHQRIFTVLSQMHLSGEYMDPVTIMDKWLIHGIFDNETEAKQYIGKLVGSVVGPTMVGQYIKIVSERYMTRKLILAAKDIIDTATTGGSDANTMVDYAEQRIYEIRSGTEIKGLTHISGIVLEKMSELDTLYQAAKAGGAPVMTGLSTLYGELDKRIHGLNKSDLIILAARPGMGKTSFAMNIATNVGKKHTDRAIAVFSLEMSKEQIVGRMLSSEASLTSSQMRTGEIASEKWRDIGRASDILSRLNIYIDDTAGVSVAGMKAKLRRMKNLGLVIIDYLQLMSSGKNYNGNRVVEISDITRNLKIMAKELNVPVICLSQLARGPEQRPDKRPLLSDLRESGSIEQDADIVMFLYRNAYYDKTDPNVNVCECIVAKNRHGEPGTVPLGWNGEFTRFTNAALAPPSGEH